MLSTPPAARAGLLVLAAALAFSALTTLTACPKDNTGGGAGGGGDVGGGVGGGEGGGTGGGGGMDAGPPDAGTCTSTVIGAVDLSGYPVVKLASGNSGVYWAALSSGGLDVVRYSGGSFGAPDHVTGSGALLEHAVAAGDTDAVLAWTQSAGAGGEVHYAHFDGANWTTAAPTTRPLVPQYPALSFAGGRAFLLWNEGPQMTAELHYQRYVSGAWSAEARLDSPPGGASVAAATADESGPVAFWGEPADAGFRLWVGELGAAGAPTTADTVHGGYKLVAAGNHAGQVMALVQQGDSTLIARRWARSSGFAEETQTTLTGTNEPLSLALLDDGSAYATWTDATGHATGAGMTSTTVGWIPFSVPDNVAALTATNGTKLALVSLGNNKLHFELHDANGWSTPLELPTGIDATALNALAVTAAGELALDVVGTVGGGASTQYAVVCH